MASFCRRISCDGATSSHSQFQLRQQTRAAEVCGVHYYYAPHRAEILLRSPRHSKLRTWVAETVVGPCGAWERSAIVKREKVGPKPCKYAATDGGSDLVVNERKRVNQAVEVALAATMTVVMAVGNRVLYKLAMVPLKQYTFFLAQFATFGYFWPLSSALIFFLVFSLKKN